MVILRKSLVPKPSVARAALIGFGASAITHPVVTFVIPGLVARIFAWMAGREIGAVWSGEFRWIVLAACCESFAVGVEAMYLRAFKLPRAFLWSLAVNFASASLGLGCSLAFGWP
ncbi:MAG: hypothetical protein ABJE95_03930 [Byssovorax sp.]